MNTEPLSIGQMIDNLYAKRTARLALDKQVEAAKAEEAALREEIIEALKSGCMEGAKGMTATASLSYKTKPNVTDWDAVHAYMKQHDMLDLVQRRLSVTLWADLRGEGVDVPGIEPMSIVDLSLTKSTRK